MSHPHAPAHAPASADAGPDHLGYLLTAYADGQLAEDGCRWLETQLEQRPELRERLETIRALQTTLRQGLAKHPPQGGLDEARRQAVLAGIRTRPVKRRRISWPLMGSLAAACLAIAFIALMAGVGTLGQSPRTACDSACPPMVVMSLARNDKPADDSFDRESGREYGQRATSRTISPTAESPAIKEEADAQVDVGKKSGEKNSDGKGKDGMVPLKLELPKPGFVGTPSNLPGLSKQAQGQQPAQPAESKSRREAEWKPDEDQMKSPNGSTALRWRDGHKLLSESNLPATPSQYKAIDYTSAWANPSVPQAGSTFYDGRTKELSKAAEATIQDHGKEKTSPAVTIITSDPDALATYDGRAEEAVSASELGATGGFMTLGDGGEATGRFGRDRRANEPDKSDLLAANDHENVYGYARQEKKNDPHKAHISVNNSWAMIQDEKENADEGRRAESSESSRLTFKTPKDEDGLSAGKPVSSKHSKPQLDYSGWFLTGLTPALAQNEWEARLQRPYLGGPLAQSDSALAMMRVTQSSGLPLRASNEVLAHLQQQQVHFTPGTTPPAGAALVRLARASGLQVRAGNGAVELELPGSPLDPCSTFALTPEAFSNAFATEPMRAVRERPQITTALDSDTASYDLAKAKLKRHEAVDAASIRAEHFINAMPQDYPPASGPEAFALYAEAAPSPFPVAYPLACNRQPVLVAVGVVGRAADAAERRPLHLTLAIDTSGSMSQPGGLARMQAGLNLLISKLSAEDRVALVTFADQARVLLPATPGNEKQRICDAIRQLQAKGGTNATEGLALAYQIAGEQAKPGCENRVVFASDGAALAGDQAASAVARAKEWRGRGITLLVLGCGDQRSDATALTELANRCDGQHVQLADDASLNELFTTRLLPARLGVLARDAKLQVTWNPDRVAYARLIGYDKRRIADRDFRNDAVDAGELSHETRVTALFEIIPADGLAGPLGQAAVRYYDTRLERVRELACPMPGSVLAASASPRLRLLACAAECAEWLQQGWWSNVRLPHPQRILQVLATCDQPAARDLEAMVKASLVQPRAAKP